MKGKILILVSLLISSAFSTYNQYRSINDLELINQINESKTTWEAGVNERFNNMNLEQAVSLLGSLETPEEKKLPVKEINAEEKDFPDSFDLRDVYPNCEALFEIRDQSTCGSCWAFGAASAMSDRICISSQGKLQTRVSTTYITSCCSYCGYGCNGGWPSEAWSFWQENGVPTGGQYGDNTTCQPYFFKPCDHHMVGKYGPCGGSLPTPKCSKQCNSQYPNKLEDDLTFGATAYSLRNNEKEIMDEIMSHGSVEIAFDVFEDFMNYKSGVYQHITGGYLGGHAVKIIGWGVENGVKYWICVNSWNEGWGENGIFRFLKGTNHCGIEGGVVAGLPNLTKVKDSLKFLK